MGDRLFGAPAGWVAATLFVLTPIFALESFHPAPEPIELAFILGSVAAALASYRFSGFVAGLSLALAVQTRETALLAAPFVFLLIRSDRRKLLEAGLAFALSFMFEMLWFSVAAGDPFYRRSLSLGHTLIPSDQLNGLVRTGLPLFSTDLIANWKREPGIYLHWSVDGALNLLANPLIGLPLVLGPLLFFALRKQLPLSQRWAAAVLLTGAALYSAGLIYGLSIDPTPRMFMVPLAAVVVALSGAILVASRSVLTIVMLAMFVLAGSVLLTERAIRTATPLTAS